MFIYCDLWEKTWFPNSNTQVYICDFTISQYNLIKQRAKLATWLWLKLLGVGVTLIFASVKYVIETSNLWFHLRQFFPHPKLRISSAKLMKNMQHNCTDWSSEQTGRDIAVPDFFFKNRTKPTFFLSLAGSWSWFLRLLL